MAKIWNNKNSRKKSDFEPPKKSLKGSLSPFTEMGLFIVNKKTSPKYQISPLVYLKGKLSPFPSSQLTFGLIETRISYLAG